MSTCISNHGEYLAHEPGHDWTCTRCGSFDEMGVLVELATLRDRLEHVEALATKWDTERDAYANHRSSLSAAWTGAVHELRAVLAGRSPETTGSGGGA